MTIARSTKHGHATAGVITPTYHSWSGMKARCLNPSNKRWADYGGRGIRVCERWMSFDNFLADMGEKLPGTSIDRIDMHGNYEPGNCRWTTPKRQARNRRDNRLMSLNGVTKTLADWAEELGIAPTTLQYRRERGWSDKDVLTRPVLRR